MTCCYLEAVLELCQDLKVGTGKIRQWVRALSHRRLHRTIYLIQNSLAVLFAVFIGQRAESETCRRLTAQIDQFIAFGSRHSNFEQTSIAELSIPKSRGGVKFRKRWSFERLKEKRLWKNQKTTPNKTLFDTGMTRTALYKYARTHAHTRYTHARTRALSTMRATERSCYCFSIMHDVQVRCRGVFLIENNDRQSQLAALI